MIIGCSNSKELGKKIADIKKDEFFLIDKKYFPDGEIYIRFAKKITGKNVTLIQSFQPKPQEALTEIIWAAANAKKLGAKKVVLVTPYLGYMRQDKMFNQGEAISAYIAANLLHKYVDKILTIDPHAHRIQDFGRLFKESVKVITANRLLAEYIKKNLKVDAILGPDEESYQWAERIADYVKVPAYVLKKERFSSRKVKVSFNGKLDVKHLKGKNIAIVDDVISTGHTIVETVKAAKKLGAKNIYCIAVHGIFAENALNKIKNAGAKKIITTNSISNSQAMIDISKLISGSL